MCSQNKSICEVTLPQPGFSALAEPAMEDPLFCGPQASETAAGDHCVALLWTVPPGAGTAPLGSLERVLSGNESICQGRGHRRPEFDPWVRMVPWRRKKATHPSILAWRIPWREEPGGLQSMGSHRVGHD